jgi:histone H3/H4
MSDWKHKLPKNQILNIITEATTHVNFSEDAKQYFGKLATDFLRVIVLKANRYMVMEKWKTLTIETINKAIQELVNEKFPYFNSNFQIKSILSYSGEMSYKSLSNRTHGIYATKLEKLIKGFKNTDFTRLGNDVLPLLAENLIRYLQLVAIATEMLNGHKGKRTIYAKEIKFVLKLGMNATGQLNKNFSDLLMETQE